MNVCEIKAKTILTKSKIYNYTINPYIVWIKWAFDSLERMSLEDMKKTACSLVLSFLTSTMLFITAHATDGCNVFINYTKKWNSPGMGHGVSIYTADNLKGILENSIIKKGYALVSSVENADWILNVDHQSQKDIYVCGNGFSISDDLYLTMNPILFEAHLTKADDGSTISSFWGESQIGMKKHTRALMDFVSKISDCESLTK
ncbi:MAG: hypothetical protein HQK53_11055 [Oligoflexia bacterium]|nr:hypothetical protein [Oligoflexia bacterium]